MKISIYIGYFKKSQVIKTASLVPIQLGKALASQHLEMMGDDTGDHISIKNPYYCELTAQYWAWKNDTTSDYIGLFHYRRFLNFFSLSDTLIDAGEIIEPCFDEHFIQKFGLYDHSLAAKIQEYDMILPLPWKACLFNKKCTVYQHYAYYHNVNDLKVAGELIRKLTPEYLPFFYQVIHGYEFYIGNLFIFKRALFEEYTAWLFKILSALEEKIDMTCYDPYEKRVLGFLAERLLGVFVAKKCHENSSLRCLHLQRIFVNDTTPLPQEPPLPDTMLPIVTLVSAADNDYAPHLGVLIKSVFLNSACTTFIEYIVLDGGIYENNKKALLALTEHRSHTSIQFVDMSRIFLEITPHSYFTRATFYRLAVPNLLKLRKKGIFLDTDMVVLSDVTSLFNIDLKEKWIAAVPDLIMRSFVAKGVPSSEESGGLTAGLYLNHVLQLNFLKHMYFQAGTLVLDFEKLRASGVMDKMIADIKTKMFWFLDQDVLNKYLKDNITYLDYTWNTVVIPHDDVLTLSKRDQEDYQRALNSPRIFHFAGLLKPWHDPLIIGARYYWHYLRETCWYEEGLFKCCTRAVELKNNASSTLSQISSFTIKRNALLRSFWNCLPHFLKKMLKPAVRKLICLKRQGLHKKGKASL